MQLLLVSNQSYIRAMIDVYQRLLLSPSSSSSTTTTATTSTSSSTVQSTEDFHICISEELFIPMEYIQDKQELIQWKLARKELLKMLLLPCEEYKHRCQYYYR
jgi:hypothetical protein